MSKIIINPSSMMVEDVLEANLVSKQFNILSIIKFLVRSSTSSMIGVDLSCLEDIKINDFKTCNLFIIHVVVR